MRTLIGAPSLADARSRRRGTEEAARAGELAIAGRVPQVELLGAQDGKRMRAIERDEDLVGLVEVRAIGVFVGADLLDEGVEVHFGEQAIAAAGHPHEWGAAR